MDLAAFNASLDADTAPPGLAPPLVALWHAGRGEPSHDWVHAHLHRVEGDLGNAGYWYRRAGQPMPKGDLAAERDAIVTVLLSRH
jgi:hypothetical protein